MSHQSLQSFDQRFEYLEKRYVLVKDKMIKKDFKLEDEFQCKLYYFLSGFELWYPDLFTFSVPNEGVRHPAVAKKLISMGLRKGVSDMIIMGNGKIAFVENKVAGGYQSPAQKRFQAIVELNRFPYALLKSNIDLRDLVKRVLAYLYELK
jgi:hypothetical protein